MLCFFWSSGIIDMFTLHVLTFDISQHRSPKYFVSSVPFIFCLMLLWQYYYYIKVHVLLHDTCHCYQYTWLYNMFCQYIWTVVVHIVWKYKYFHYNSFTPQLLLTYKNMFWQYFHSCVFNTIHNFREKIHFILNHMFKSCCK